MNIDAVKARLAEMRAVCEADTLARHMHSIYEIEAARGGWVTQAKCQVPFDELPPANKQVMLGTAEAVLAILPVPAFLDYADGLVARYEAAEEAGRRRMGFPAGKRHALRTELAELAALLEVAE